MTTIHEKLNNSLATCTLPQCYNSIYTSIKTHGSVLVAKKSRKRKRVRTPVCYLCDRSNSRFQPIITQKLRCLFLPILHILMPSYTAPYIPNLKGIAQAVPEIRDPETWQIFFVFFFFFAPNKIAHSSSSCAPFSTKFGTQIVLPKHHFSKKFGSICSEIDENMSDIR